MKALAGLVLTLIVTGCAGMVGGDKENQWCLVGLDDSQTESVLSASNEWHEKTDGRVNFSFVSVTDSKDCGSLDQIKTVWVEGQYSAHTDWNFKSGNTINVNLQQCDNPEYFSAIVMHEFGHYLNDPHFGVNHHSSDPRDVMANLAPSDHPAGFGYHLTPGDVEAFNQANR